MNGNRGPNPNHRAGKISVEKICEDLLLQSKANGVALERMGEQILALQDTIEALRKKKDDVKKTLDMPEIR